MLFRKLPPLSALAAFEAVARHRSFTNAGKELFLTHGAVSQRISLLEKHLNTRLFARSNRAVELTAEGARYLEAVRDALSKLTSASDQFSPAIAWPAGCLIFIDCIRASISISEVCPSMRISVPGKLTSRSAGGTGTGPGSKKSD